MLLSPCNPTYLQHDLTKKNEEVRIHKKKLSENPHKEKTILIGRVWGEEEVLAVAEVKVDSWDNTVGNKLESEITNSQDLYFFGKALIVSSHLLVVRIRVAFL